MMRQIGTTMSPTESLDETRAWMAVKNRDRSQDGAFVFAVTTTGIYCRPSCPARRPRRRNVRFFGVPEKAEAAGFRPCRRCRPQAGKDDPAAAKVRTAQSYLEAHLDETVTLEHLAGEVGCSPWHLQRLFKARTGLSPRQYVNARRLERLRRHLKAGDDVTTALYEAGFGASSQLYGQSDARLGMSPGRYRRGGAGAHIRFATADSKAGRLLVAATDKGVCFVALGSSDEEVGQALREEFPQARVEPAEGALEPWIEAVLARIDDGSAPRPPLDVAGTDFQRRVWHALTEIPRGTTLAYGELARQIGQPTAARAVARACATNPVAVVVPCHRVVAAGGKLGGYRWGVERKRELLAREGAVE
jgi:AraC family transcriptional regulator of adaptative response/methylated-DNA-[protein]-cysteine methyltransferase